MSSGSRLISNQLFNIAHSESHGHSKTWTDFIQHWP
jgi:hypothetical protein